MILLQESDKITKEKAESKYDITIRKNTYSSYWVIPLGRENQPREAVILSKEFVLLYEGKYESIYGKLIQKKKK